MCIPGEICTEMQMQFHEDFFFLFLLGTLAWKYGELNLRLQKWQTERNPN